MLVLQIAGGIVLAAVVLRFWRQGLLVVGGAIAVVLAGGLVLVAVARGWIAEDFIVPLAGFFVGAVAIREWRRRKTTPS